MNQIITFCFFNYSLLSKGGCSMKLISFRTIVCLLMTTLVYIGYYLYGLNQKISQPIKQSDFINSFWLQNNPLLWFYLVSIVMILVIGILSKIQADKVQAEQNQRKRKKQRKNYSI